MQVYPVTKLQCNAMQCKCILCYAASAHCTLHIALKGCCFQWSYCFYWDFYFHWLLFSLVFSLTTVFTGSSFLLCAWLLFYASHNTSMICSLNSWQSRQMKWAPYKCTLCIYKVHFTGSSASVQTAEQAVVFLASQISPSWCYTADLHYNDLDWHELHSLNIHWIATERYNITVLHILPISPGSFWLIWATAARRCCPALPWTVLC